MKMNSANSRRGMTLVEVSVVIAVIVLLAMMFLPALMPAKRHSSALSCLNVEKQILLSLKTWAVDNNDKYPMQVPAAKSGSMEAALRGDVLATFRVMSNELTTPKLLICPADKSRTVASDFGSGLRNANISYFIGIDVTDTNDSALLIGDRNLSLNGKLVNPGLFSFTSNSLVGWTKELHIEHGNVGLGDGSVQQYSNAKFQGTLTTTGFATNRLAIP